MTVRSGQIENGSTVTNFVSACQDTFHFHHQPASREYHPDEREPWLIVSHYDSTQHDAGVHTIWLRPNDAHALASILESWATMAERVPLETRWLDGKKVKRRNTHPRDETPEAKLVATIERTLKEPDARRKERP